MAELDNEIGFIQKLFQRKIQLKTVVSQTFLSLLISAGTVAGNYIYDEYVAGQPPEYDLGEAYGGFNATQVQNAADAAAQLQVLQQIVSLLNRTGV
jgi:hypothetical protein